MVFRRFFKRRRYSRSGRWRRRSQKRTFRRRFVKKLRTNFIRQMGKSQKSQKSQIDQVNGSWLPRVNNWKLGLAGVGLGAAVGGAWLHNRFSPHIQAMRDYFGSVHGLGDWRNDPYLHGSFEGIHLSPELNRYYNNMHAAYIAGDDFTINELKNMQADELAQYKQAVWNWESGTMRPEGYVNPIHGPLDGPGDAKGDL